MTADRWLQAASNLVAALLGLFIGLAIVGFEGVEPWLYKWSTLIAGALAVLAAFITVFQMGRVDIRQQQRHEQLVKLSLRADALRAERAANAAEFLEWLATEGRPNFSGPVTAMAASSFANEATKWRKSIGYELLRPAQIEVVGLLDGFRSSNRETLDHLLADLEDACDQLASDALAIEPNEVLARSVATVASKASQVASWLKTVGEDLEGLWKEYR